MTTPLITLSQVNYQASGRHILHDINLKLWQDEILTIVGPNGAGKSTLLAIILRHLTPSSGCVTHHRQLNISYLPQRFYVAPDFPMTARRFLQDIKHAADSPWLARLKIRDLLDKPLQSLSGGETQRLLLVRTLLRAPDLIVLDEPAAGIDPAALSEFYQTIQSFQQQNHSSIIMVSHDLHLVMAGSNKVLCLNRHICCKGTPEAVHNHPEFQALLGNVDPDNIAFYPHQHNHQHL